MTTTGAVAHGGELAGRTVLVTGARGTIGAGIVERAVAAGARVVAHQRGTGDGLSAQGVVAGSEPDVVAGSGPDVVEGSAPAGEVVAWIAGDLEDAAACDAVLDAAVAAVGTLDVVVNNAGVQDVAALREVGASELDRMFAVNVRAAHLLTRRFAAHRAPLGGGVVVNIASIEGHEPAAGHGHYAASKAALLMATRAAAQEFGGQGLRVVSVSPGLIDRAGLEADWPDGVTRYRAAAALGTIGTAADIGEAVVFLASDRARWITGTDLVVDGGVRARATW